MRVQLNRGRIERPNVEQTPYLLHVFPKQEGIGYELLLSCVRDYLQSIPDPPSKLASSTYP